MGHPTVYRSLSSLVSLPFVLSVVKLASGADSYSTEVFVADVIAQFGAECVAVDDLCEVWLIDQDEASGHSEIHIANASEPAASCASPILLGPARACEVPADLAHPSMSAASPRRGDDRKDGPGAQRSTHGCSLVCGIRLSARHRSARITAASLEATWSRALRRSPRWPRARRWARRPRIRRGRCSCLLRGHATIERSVALPARMQFSICRRYALAGRDRPGSRAAGLPGRFRSSRRVTRRGFAP